MKPEQAFDLLDQVCSRFQGTRQDHANLIQALELLKNLVNKAQSCCPETVVVDNG